MNNLIRKAFTLIELLVVIAIIGILSGLIIVGMSGMTQSANLAKAQVFSSSLRNSLLMNLVSEYKFDSDGSDSWGINSGAITGASITSSGCVYGSCLSCDGSGDYVLIPDSPSLSSVWSSSHIFTLETWIYSTYLAGYQGIINKRNSDYFSASPGGLFIDNDGNRLLFLIGTGNENESNSSIAYSLTNLHDKWIHVVGTSNGTQLTLYINGVRVGNPLSFAQNPPANSDPMTIGSFHANSRSFNGKIDNVRIYNATLTSQQVEERYYAGVNDLFKNKSISKEDYLERMVSLSLKD